MLVKIICTSPASQHIKDCVYFCLTASVYEKLMMLTRKGAYNLVKKSSSYMHMHFVRCPSNNLQNIKYKVQKPGSIFCNCKIWQKLLMLSKKENNVVETHFVYVLCVRCRSKNWHSIRMYLKQHLFCLTKSVYENYYVLKWKNAPLWKSKLEASVKTKKFYIRLLFVLSWWRSLAKFHIHFTYVKVPKM